MLVTSSLSITSSFLFGLVDLVPILLDSRYLRSLRRLSSSGSIAGLSLIELSEFRLGCRLVCDGLLKAKVSANISNSARGALRCGVSSEFPGRWLVGGRGKLRSEEGSGFRGPSFACRDLVFCNSLLSEIFMAAFDQN